MGWSGIKNGALLELAQQRGFDVFLTGDQNLAFQQDLGKLGLAVIVLEAAGTQLHQTFPLMPKVAALLSTIKSGQVIRVRP